VNLITNKPTGELSGEGTIDIGNYGTRNLAGVLNAPLASSVDARLAVQSTQHDGYLSDAPTMTGVRRGALQIKYTPNDAFTLDTSGDYYHQGGKGPGATLLQSGAPASSTAIRESATPPPPSTRFTRPLLFPGRQHLRAAARQRARHSPLPADVHQDNDLLGTPATAEWKADAGTWTLVPAYRTDGSTISARLPGFLIDQQRTTVRARSRRASRRTRIDP